MGNDERWQAASHLLEEEYGYDPRAAELALGDLQNAESSIAASFLEWCNTGKLDSETIGGLNACILVSEWKMKPPAAFLTLAWLARDPSGARATLDLVGPHRFGKLQG